MDREKLGFKNKSERTSIFICIVSALWLKYIVIKQSLLILGIWNLSLEVNMEEIKQKCVSHLQKIVGIFWVSWKSSKFATILYFGQEKTDFARIKCMEHL